MQLLSVSVLNNAFEPPIRDWPSRGQCLGWPFAGRDGVNIAARLEAIAEPGRILVCSSAHDHIGSKG